MSLNDTVMLSVMGTVGGQKHVHTLHFRSILVDVGDQTLIDAWQSSARGYYRALFDSGDTPVDVITVQQVCGTVPLRAPVPETEVGSDRIGTKSGSGGMEPTFVAAYASTKTAFSGKSRQGRFYIGGLRGSDVTLNTCTDTYLGIMQAYCTALLGAFGPSGSNLSWRLVVHSKKLAAIPDVECQDCSTLITTIVPHKNLATMRSRKLGHGD